MNFALNKKRKKLKPTCHILTITQVRKMGKPLKLPTLASAMESFMEPSNLFFFNKPKLAIIHQYLLDNQLTQVKQPLIRSRQQDHARLLIDLIYPGYPIGTAKEQAWRQDRESRRTLTKKGVVLYFAYDQLPTKVSFERLEELVRLDTPSSPSETISTSPPSSPSSSSASSSTYRYTINMRELERRNSAGSKNKNIRLHMYIWMSPRHPLLPYFTSLTFDGAESWYEKDQETVANRFKYIDITDKIDWDLDGKTTIEMEFTLDDSLVSATVNHVTICCVWEKSSAELVCQLYTKTASNCISFAMGTNKDIDQTQRDAVHLLDQCQPKDRWCLDKTETLFLDCGRTFYQNNEVENEDDDDNTDDELTMGNEYISLMDPILLTKINHPARGIFCRHATCFDAKCFFQCYIPQQLWTCPICHIQIRGIQDLYIDYDLKLAITTYPEHSRFILLHDGTYQTETQYQQSKDLPPLPSHRPLSPLVLKRQLSLSPAPPSPLLLSSNKHDDGNTMDDLDISDCDSMIDDPPGKRMKVDLLDYEPVISLD